MYYERDPMSKRHSQLALVGDHRCYSLRVWNKGFWEKPFIRTHDTCWYPEKKGNMSWFSSMIFGLPSSRLWYWDKVNQRTGIMTFFGFLPSLTLKYNFRCSEGRGFDFFRSCIIISKPLLGMFRSIERFLYLLRMIKLWITGELL